MKPPPSHKTLPHTTRAGINENSESHGGLLFSQPTYPSARPQWSLPHAARPCGQPRKQGGALHSCQPPPSYPAAPEQAARQSSNVCAQTDFSYRQRLLVPETYRIDGVCFVDGVLCGCLPPTKETDFLALWAILATNNKEARSGAECQAALAVAKP
jgi:hypothetical protein